MKIIEIKGLKSYVDKTRMNKETLMNQKCYAEIFILPLLTLFLVVFHDGSIPLLMVYANFLRLKYMLNERTKKGWENLNSKI